MLKGKPDYGRYLAGSEIGFHVYGYGVAYPTNLTSDPETGLLHWSVKDVMRAVRQGRRPDGSKLAPLMPWPENAHLSDKDARALATYIKSLPAIEHATPVRVEDPAEAKKPFLTIIVPEQASPSPIAQSGSLVSDRIGGGSAESARYLLHRGNTEVALQ